MSLKTECPCCMVQPPDVDVIEEIFTGADGSVEYICCDCGTLYIDHYIFDVAEVLRLGWD